MASDWIIRSREGGIWILKRIFKLPSYNFLFFKKKNWNAVTLFEFLNQYSKICLFSSPPLFLWEMSRKFSFGWLKIISLSLHVSSFAFKIKNIMLNNLSKLPKKNWFQTRKIWHLLWFQFLGKFLVLGSTAFKIWNFCKYFTFIFHSFLPFYPSPLSSPSLLNFWMYSQT